MLGLFDGELQKMVALAVLAPIVASQGGNAATQTMTVAVRALATRELGHANAWRVVVRELMVGVVNGVAFAVITGVAALRLVQGAGPRHRHRAGDDLQPGSGRARRHLDPAGAGAPQADPAVSSGVFVTTVTDVVGFFSFLGIATLWFGLK